MSVTEMWGQKERRRARGIEERGGGVGICDDAGCACPLGRPAADQPGYFIPFLNFFFP